MFTKNVRRLYARCNSRSFCSNTTPQTVLVTGGNTGIGLQISKQLHNEGINVIMACQNIDDGASAVQQNFTNQSHSSVTPLELDITNAFSMNNAVKFVEKNFDSIDTLINCAGINLSDDRRLYHDINKKCSHSDIINKTLDTNYYGTMEFTNAMMPLLKKHKDTSNSKRIVCFSNRDAALGKMSEELSKEFLKDDLDELELNYWMEQYKKSALKEGNTDVITTKDGWINSAYLMGYVGINMFVRILGRDNEVNVNAGDGSFTWISAYCPGVCATDATDHFGERSSAQGAHGATTLATMLMDENVSDANGSFWSAFFENEAENGVEMEIMDWVHPQKTISFDSLCNELIGAMKGDFE